MTKDTHRHATAPAAETAEQLSAAGGAFTEAMMKSTSACLDAVTRLNGEVFGFVNDRLRRDIDFGQSLARCGNWTEAASLQQEWARRTMQDYFAESTKLMQMASKATLESMDPMLRTAAHNVSGLMRAPAETHRH